MRIISKFKDYYDSASAYGVDMEKIYQRKQRTEFITLEYHGYGSFNMNLGKYDVLGFCGKIYPFLNVSNYLDAPDVKKERILYGEEAIVNQFNKKWSPTDPNREPMFVEDEHLKSSWSNPRERYDELVSNEMLLSFFEKFNTPIFWINNKSRSEDRLSWKDGVQYSVEINPNLKDLCFFKAKDAVQAFAEIHQFLDVIQSKDTQVEVPVGGNDVVGRSKGFDENSFRKEPTKKKYGKKSKRKKL